MFTLILLVFAFVIAVIAAFIAPPPTQGGSPNYSRLLAVALAFFFLACIFDTAPLAHVFGNANGVPAYVR